MTVVVGTAGHIDHGKTTLLSALTGIDADRLPEERRRGLTIDVGYAHGSPDGGPEIDYVDVPGHDRLVGNMLVGAGEIDAALLVVAADDGPRPQTWEHLGLLDAMGIPLGVVAITKADLVEPDRALVVAAAMGRALESTLLAGSPVVVVAAPTGAGLRELRGALAGLRDRVAALPARHRSRRWLAVDRAFAVRGHGVVATGTSRGAPIGNADVLRLLPDGRRVRVRAVQVHDVPVGSPAGPGRVALNLAGVELAQLRRGQLLTDEAGGRPLDAFTTDRLLVSLRPPAALPGQRADDPWPPADGTELRLHIGTDQVGARLGRGGRLDVVLDQDQALALLRLERPVATAIGERFLLRRPPPAGLLAGGTVLAADLPRGRARPRLHDPERLRSLAAAVAVADEEAIERALVALHGSLGGSMAPDIAALARSSLSTAVSTYQRAHPADAGLPLPAARAAVIAAIRPRLEAGPADLATMAESALDAAVASVELVRTGDVVHMPGYEPAIIDPTRAAAQDRLVALLDVDAPPRLSAAASEAGCDDADLRALEGDGRIVVVEDDLAWSAPAYQRLRDRAVALADEAPLTPAGLRDATGTSRKYVLALLEDLDRRGILKRTAGGHVRGPRA